MSNSSTRICVDCGTEAAEYPTEIDGEPVELCKGCMIKILGVVS